MILVDAFGHMVATDNETELHKFARKMGLKKSWYQRRDSHPHYDLLNNKMIDQAIEEGAQLASSRRILREAWWAVDHKKFKII